MSVKRRSVGTGKSNAPLCPLAPIQEPTLGPVRSACRSCRRRAPQIAADDEDIALADGPALM
ncbi:MAG: hypothetical protein ACREX3_03310 [Gammaproteobacteria bacterium]